MPKNFRSDYILIAVFALLVFCGILILASVSASIAQVQYGNPSYYLFHQILFGFLPGIFLAFLAFKIPLSFFKKWSLVFLLVVLLFCFLVFLPKIGISRGGASRWINLGKITFQPSEFLKLAFIIYLSAWLSTRGEIFQRKKTKLNSKFKITLPQTQILIPFLIIIGLITLVLILQRDMSTMIVIALVGVLIYFLAKTPLWHTILLFLIGGGLVAVLIKIVPYRLHRLLVFLNPEIDPLGMGYQIKQALITVGSGGIKGVGLSFGVQKYGFLPQPMSDSIFAVFAEETGFIGALLLVVLFLIFFWRGFEISKRSPDKFSQLMAAGITFWIIIQAFVNIGSMVGILPLTGIPLPFISYGGSALIAELIGVGILLNISKSTTQ